jgi:hypothetical protein
VAWTRPMILLFGMHLAFRCWRSLLALSAAFEPTACIAMLQRTAHGPAGVCAGGV